MWKRGVGVGGVSIIKPRNYTTVLLGGRVYLCAFSGSSVSSLYATWAVPAGVAVLCGHHLWATEEKFSGSRLHYLEVSLWKRIWTDRGTEYVMVGVSTRLAMSFNLLAPELFF